MGLEPTTRDPPAGVTEVCDYKGRGGVQGLGFSDISFALSDSFCGSSWTM